LLDKTLRLNARKKARLSGYRALVSDGVNDARQIISTPSAVSAKWSLSDSTQRYIVREVTPAIAAAASTVTIVVRWPHSLHQVAAEALRLLNTTMRSVSIVISVLFVVLTAPPR
jgi:uncharacterized membrane protein YcjF (UPF0283 family)